MFALLSLIDSSREFFERLSNFSVTNIWASLLLMLFSVVGVFIVLLVFYVIIRLLQKVFPPKNE